MNWNIGIGGKNDFSSAKKTGVIIKIKNYQLLFMKFSFGYKLDSSVVRNENPGPG